MSNKIFYPLIGVLLTLEACSPAVNKRDVDNVRSDIKSMREVHGEQSVSIEEIKEQVRILSGRVEELEHRTSDQMEQVQRTVKQFSTRVPPPAGVPDDLLSRDEERTSGIRGEESAIFKDGLHFMRAGQFEDAVQSFDRFAQTNSTSALTDNALFWSGIANEKLGYYERALFKYGEIVEKFPNEDIAPDALFRLGEVFIKRGEDANAKVAFEKFQKDFPSHPRISEVHSRMASLKNKR